MCNTSCSPCRSQNIDLELGKKKDKNGEETQSGLAKLELKEVIAFQMGNQMGNKREQEELHKDLFLQKNKL